MKKRIGLLCCALLLVVGILTGCFGSDPEIDESAPPSMTENVTVSTISLPDEVIIEKKDPVETINRTATYGNIVVDYPQILGLADAAIEDAANALIKTDVKTFAKKYLADAETVYETGAMTDTIIHHENIISIVTTGSLIHKSAESEDTDAEETEISEKEKTTLVYTTNLSLATGERISTGVREQAATMATMILEGRAVLLETDGKRKADVTDYLQQLGEEKLTALLQSCDFAEGEGYPKCFSYYMDENADDIGIYIPVGKTLGDYAIVLINASI